MSSSSPVPPPKAGDEPLPDRPPERLFAVGWGGLWVTLLLFFVYLLSYSGVPHAVDELSALSATETLSINRLWHVNQMEWDQSRTPPQNIVGVDGNLYSKKGIGASLIALPLLWAGKQWPHIGAVQLAFLTGALVTALAALFFYGLCLHLDYSRSTALWGTLALGLGTLLWPYARTLFGESLGALGLSMALAGAVAFRRFSPERSGYASLLVAGIGLAILTLAKSSNAVVAPFFALYLLYARLWEGRHGLVDLGGSPDAASANGAAVSSPAWYSRPSVVALGRLLLQGLCVAVPVAIGAAITVGYNYTRFHTLLTFPLESFESFSTPLQLGMAGLLASPGKGLIWYVPLTWLALLGIPKWRQQRRLPDFLLALSTLLAPLVLYALWYDWPGGRAWGPRMIVVTMPAIAMLALPALDGLVQGPSSRWMRWVTALLLGLSLLVQLPGVLVNFELREAADMQSGVTFEQLVWQAERSPLFTYWTSLLQGPHDPWWLQPSMRSLSPWLWLAILTLTTLSVALFWISARSKSASLRNHLLIVLTSMLLLFSVTIVLVAADDPRWHERTAVHADNLALFTLLEDQAEAGDLALLDLLPGYDLDGRQWLWMNTGPANLPYLGWLRKTEMENADAGRLTAWLTPYRRVWLVLQETAEDDASSTTEQWLDGRSYRGEQTWVGSQRAVEYLLPSADGPWVTAGNSFDDLLVLNAYRVAETHPVVDATGDRRAGYLVDLDWDRQATPALRFSVQALDAAGQLIAQVDRSPGSLNGFADKIGLSSATRAQAIILKVYDAGDGHLLPVRDVDGKSNDYLTLAINE